MTKSWCTRFYTLKMNSEGKASWIVNFIKVSITLAQDIGHGSWKLGFAFSIIIWSKNGFLFVNSGIWPNSCSLDLREHGILKKIRWSHEFFCFPLPVYFFGKGGIVITLIFFRGNSMRYETIYANGLELGKWC